MKKIKQILFGAVIAIMIIEITVFTGNTICHAADDNPTVGENLTMGEVYDTALEFAYGDTFRSVYENRLAGSPLETEGADGVDTATGHLMLSRTDLSLDGTGGMDFELNRYYDSNEANLGHAMVEHVDELKRDTIWVEYTAEDGAKRKLVVNAALLSNHKDALKNLIGSSYKKGEVQHKDVIRPEGGTQRTKIVSNERHNVYGVASGWRYDFPWIETVILTEDEGWGKIPAYLHFGSAGVASISYKADNDSKTYQITGLEDYDYQDIRLEDFEQTVNGVACRYLLRDKTGLRTYFNEDGVIVLQKDAHNNTISYTYTDGIYFSKITDSVGREILFHYDDEEGEKVLASVTVQGMETEGGVAKQTVTYETDRKSYTPLHGDRLHGFILTSAVVDGRKEKYGYKTVERLVSTAGEGAASQRVSTNQSYLLTKITADGCEQYYEYRGCSLRGTKQYGTGQKRDVVTGQFYVTREYQKDLKTGKKSEGIKYDYFQRQDDTLISFADFEEGKNEVWQYGKSGLKTAALVSTFNPNKYKTNKKYYDYKYKKSKINAGTLRLKKDTKKNASLYIYNENKQLAEQVEYGQEKQETLYRYDKDGKGSLVVQETSKSYGKKGSGAMVSKQGYTYDVYRNLLTSKSPRAYLKKNKGKEHLFTTTYNYHATDKGYPAGDAAAALSTLESQENYSSAGTKVRMTGVIASNGMDIISISGQKSVGGGAYQTISKTDFSYDAHGNEIQGKVYPAYSKDGEAEMIQNDYTYNELGQQTKRTVAISSAKRPADSRTYTEEEITYDSFGNELTYTDANGLVSKTTYDPKTGEETETINAVGTEYESADKEYQSSDGLKTMTVDNYGRVTITIQDAFGNTLISKDEAAGTWTESVYEYGSTEGDGDTEDDEEKEEVTRLVEERTYVFEPDEKRFIINEDGETVPNYYITGKGKEILRRQQIFL